MATSESAGTGAVKMDCAVRRFEYTTSPWSRAGLLISQCFLIAGLAYGAFVFVTHFVIQSVQVVGSSMAPTLEDSSRHLLNRWVYLLREPQPLDIVVIREPDDQTFAVKRIVAREGDSVHFKNGKIIVNGKALNEPYLPQGTMTFASPKVTEQFVVCGKDQYFVLGDNRNNSHDSRMFGCVPRQNILGVIIQ
jgi:signal peptidase I